MFYFEIELIITCLDDTYTAVDKYNDAKKTTSNNKPIRTYFVKRDNSEQLQKTGNKTPGPNTKHSHSGHIITAGNCERVYFV